MKNLKALLLLAVIVAAASAWAASSERYLHVKVSNAGTHELVRVNVPLSLAEIEGTTGGNTIPLIDRLVEIHGLVVPASAAAVDGISAAPGTFVYDPEMPVAADLIQLAVSTVPEPNTLALLAAGVTAFGVLRRRRPRLAG